MDRFEPQSVICTLFYHASEASQLRPLSDRLLMPLVMI